MVKKIDGQTYYTTSEICREVGISRPTFFRWLSNGLLAESRKDKRGWRLFTEEELQLVKNETQKIEVVQLIKNTAQV